MQELDWARVAEAAPAVAELYAATYVLNAALPALIVKGYVLDPSGSETLYRINGLLVLLVTAGLAAFACVRGDGKSASLDFIYRYYAECATSAFLFGLLVSLAFYIRGRELLADGRIDRAARCQTVDTPKGQRGKAATDTSEFDGRSGLAHFYCGLSEFNPATALGVDFKMWLYIVGAVQLELNLLSCLAAHVQARAGAGSGSGAGVALGSWGTASYAMACYAACLTFFVVEYLAHEAVHIYTYDIFRERVGLKLAWGCMFFYPFFYCIGALPLVEAGPGQDITPAVAGAITALYLLGWVLTRGANMQKYWFKRGADKFLGGVLHMVAVPGSGNRLLCSGFWALSRHVNYCGEIVQAVALALPGYLATGSYVPWLYPLYYVALFIPRQLDDDAMCAAKYGPVWAEYCKRVPYRIVPYVY